ncbi:zf-HC2 domain-containing protein [Dermacoccus nishinomiyaensis]
MSSDEHAMLELYVLDAVDEMERRRFDKHLRACSTCRQQRDSMREVLADLSRMVAMPAPPQLREASSRDGPIDAAARQYCAG